METHAQNPSLEEQLAWEVAQIELITVGVANLLLSHLDDDNPSKQAITLKLANIEKNKVTMYSKGPTELVTHNNKVVKLFTLCMRILQEEVTLHNEMITHIVKKP